MKKLFVSVPTNNREPKDIETDILEMQKIAEKNVGEPLRVISSYIIGPVPEINNSEIWCLSESLKELATADVFIGIANAGKLRIQKCEAENLVASLYNIERYSVTYPIGIDCGKHLGE